jgi:hypothetical protein
MKAFRPLLVAAVLALTIGAAHAHGVMKPQHGGIVEMVGHMGFELVRRDDGADLYLAYNHKGMPTEGMTGTLTVTSGESKSEVALTPAGGNKFTASGVKIPGGSKVVALITLKEPAGKKIRALITVP